MLQIAVLLQLHHFFRRASYGGFLIAVKEGAVQIAQLAFVVGCQRIDGLVFATRCALPVAVAHVVLWQTGDAAQLQVTVCAGAFQAGQRCKLAAHALALRGYAR